VAPLLSLHCQQEKGWLDLTNKAQQEEDDTKELNI